MVRSAKALIYLIEFINIYAAIYYSNFIFFYLRLTFRFGEVENLLTAAVGGVFYVIVAWQGGKLADRYGGIRMLYAGTCGIILSLVLGAAFSTPAAQVVVYCLWTAGVCFVWPSLEALISDRAGDELPKMVGIYNITWAAGGAVAYFSAGMLIENLGIESVFWLPCALTVVELALIPCAAILIKKESNLQLQETKPAPVARPEDSRVFLRMAWLANPFSYVAINTVIPLIPTIAEKLDLTTGWAGIVCSIWMFARLAAFTALSQWTGWHYRFRWLAGSFIVMIFCFWGILMSQSVGILLIAQVGFGISAGLIYYSSIYYSMNVTEKRGANAGIHEAMIGAGLFVGPAVGAASLYLLPAVAGTGAWSVGGLLCAGFSGLILLRHYRMKA